MMYQLECTTTEFSRVNLKSKGSVELFITKYGDKKVQTTSSLPMQQPSAIYNLEQCRDQRDSNRKICSCRCAQGTTWGRQGRGHYVVVTLYFKYYCTGKVTSHAGIFFQRSRTFIQSATGNTGKKVLCYQKKYLMFHGLVHTD